MPSTQLFHQLREYIKSLDTDSIPPERKQVLQPLTDYLQEKISKARPVNLNFICTHNSRRSQFAQVWAQVAAAYHGADDVHCFSGGTEATAFNPRAVEALKRAGLHISRENGENPVFTVHFSDKDQPLQCFSKVYDHPENPNADFAAVMTCS
ncbi:MAG: protein-tyrosine-phosphatase [Owenweeksia sp.]|nr:protein-tyrosine-phosphatase [Owenweeksia sp.]